MLEVGGRGALGDGVRREHRLRRTVGRAGHGSVGRVGEAAEIHHGRGDVVEQRCGQGAGPVDQRDPAAVEAEERLGGGVAVGDAGDEGGQRLDGGERLGEGDPEVGVGVEVDAVRLDPRPAQAEGELVTGGSGVHAGEGASHQVGLVVLAQRHAVDVAHQHQGAAVDEQHPVATERLDGGPGLDPAGLRDRGGLHAGGQ